MFHELNTHCNEIEASAVHVFIKKRLKGLQFNFSFFAQFFPQLMSLIGMEDEIKSILDDVYQNMSVKCKSGSETKNGSKQREILR